MITKGRKEDYQRKEGSRPREGRKMIMGRMNNYKGKEERLPKDERKSTKEDD